MAHLVFTDTTVCLNLDLVGRADLLTAVARENARWTATIQRECLRQEALQSMPGFAARIEAQLGEPLHPRDDEHQAIRNLRRTMAAPGDHPEAHLGEAETLTIIDRRRLEAIFVSDDLKARPFAGGKPCIGTFDFLRLALRLRVIDEVELRRIRTELLKHRRVHDPAVRSAQRFEAWLQG